MLLYKKLLLMTFGTTLVFSLSLYFTTTVDDVLHYLLTADS